MVQRHTEKTFKFFGLTIKDNIELMKSIAKFFSEVEVMKYGVSSVIHISIDSEYQEKKDDER